MILRFAALLTVAVGSILLGKQKGDRLYKQLNNQQGMIMMVETIKRNIFCYRMPIGEILNGFSKDVFEDEQILIDMIKLGPEQGYKVHNLKFGYDAYTDQKIFNFFRKLGSLGVSEQMSACEDLLSGLIRYCDSQRNDFPRLRKLYVTLGAAFGLGVVILFI